VQVERIARVELPPPHTSLILWSWHKLPVCSSPFDYFRSNARPNTIQEREIYSSNPRQLKAAFIHLSSLAHRRMTELAATPDVNMLHENDAPLPDVFSTMEVTSSDYRTPAIVEIEQDDEVSLQRPTPAVPASYRVADAPRVACCRDCGDGSVWPWASTVRAALSSSSSL
jgi:hypothetical protein